MGKKPLMKRKSYNPHQHCTSKKCPYGHSHTAEWCGYTQKRKCPCPWDYPKARER